MNFPPETVVGPVLLEMCCDGGRSDMTIEEMYNYGKQLREQHGEEFMKEHPFFPGCGTKFKFYLGGMAMCPECGRQYLVKWERYKAGGYKVLDAAQEVR